MNGMRMLALVGLVGAAAWGQGTAQSYVRLCAGCHGADGKGGARGPGLGRVRDWQVEAILGVIRDGVPQRGMPSFAQLPESELRATAAETKRLAAAAAAPPGESARADVGEIGFDRIVNPLPGEWPTYHGRLDGNRFSPLRQIDRKNVGRLAVRWMFPVRGAERLESTPLVADGTMYVTSVNQVQALHAATGKLLWTFSRPRTPGLAGDAAGGINRGVALLGKRVFVATDHAHLLALDRGTGKLLWETTMADHRQNYGATGAPLVVGDLVVAGVSGGDEGVRGFLAAYSADTGKEVWRFWTVPGVGEPQADTWGNPEALAHGCATTWLTGSYDAELDLLYWTTGNPCPDYDGEVRPGDNLYSDSVLALEAKTGKLRWHFQFTPHDTHDWDAVQPVILADADWQGRPRKLLLQANRNGFFYVLDRVTGEFLKGEPFAKQTWADGLDATGRPRVKPGTEPSESGTIVCPAVEGATNWFSTAYDPAVQILYVMALDKCSVYRRKPEAWQAGRSYYGGEVKTPKNMEPARKILRAIQVTTGKIVWEAAQEGPANTWGGVLGTEAGLVFYADDSGGFSAADAQTGKTLWRFPANVTWRSSPMTYLAEGRQYVAITAASVVLAFGLPEQ